MNFSSVMENIMKLEDYSARRLSWSDKSIFVNIAGFVMVRSNSDYNYYQLSCRDFEATDWELVRES